MGKKILVLIVAALGTACSGCASTSKLEPSAPPVASPSEEPENAVVDGVLRVSGPDGVAHACPIELGDGRKIVFSSRHVALNDTGRPPNIADTHWVAWTDDVGGFGFLQPMELSWGRDLSAWAVVTGTISRWYRISPTGVTEGQKLFFLEYNWDSTKQMFADRRRTAKVLRTQAGQIVYTPAGKKGSSGSCLLDENGEVKGINNWYFGPEDNGNPVGVGAAFWKGWAE